MPPFVRHLVVLLIALPGTLMWFLGAIGTMSYFAFIIMGKVNLQESAIFGAALAAALLGHLMHTFSGNLLGEAEQQLGANQIGAKLGLDAAVDLLGLGTAGAGVALAPAFASGDWQRGLLGLGLLAVFGPSLAFVIRKRQAFLKRWEEENRMPVVFEGWQEEAPEAGRAGMHAGGSRETSRPDGARHL